MQRKADVHVVPSSRNKKNKLIKKCKINKIIKKHIVVTILRPPGAKIMQNMSFVAARGCQELPGAARNALRGQKSKNNW